MAAVSIAIVALVGSTVLAERGALLSPWNSGGIVRLSVLMVLAVMVGLLSGLLYHTGQQLAANAAAARVARAALAESEEKFRAVAENARAAFGVVRGTRFAYANPYFAELTGYSVAELLTMDFPQLVHPSFQPMMLDLARRRQLGQSVPSHYEFLMVAKDGHTRWIDFSPARIELSGAPAIIGTGFDVTDRRLAEEALARKAVEAEKAGDELRRAHESAEAASAAKDRFLAVLSHELRNPLTPVLATASLLQQDDRLDQPTRDHLEVIRRNAELEARLIDDLLDVTRISRGKVELDRRPMELCTILRHAVEVCQGDIEARGLRFALEIKDPPHVVHADGGRLQQVFWNIIKNAVKFTPHGGWVEVRCWREIDDVFVEVRDSGVGIESEALGRIFNAFEQAEVSITRQFGGLGLGLAISKALVELHGGGITASSEGKGRGSTFLIRLPLSRSPVPAAVAPQPPHVNDSEVVPALRILLVEDHGDTAHIMTQLLVRQGYLVHAAGDVAAALQLAGSRQFDVLLSDLGLPDGSGLGLLRELRARGHCFPAIALSGYGQDQDIRESLAAGFAKHITKPVDVRRLAEAVSSLAGASPKVAATASGPAVMLP